jgi:hypothetical protein
MILSAVGTNPLEPLFTPGAAEDRAYCNQRSRTSSPEAQVGRAFAEQLWARYFPYADENFLIEIRRDFHARFWEMYLTCALLLSGPQRGYSVSCPKPGPDILLVHGGHRIWIEAVAATDGDPGKADSVIEPNKGHPYRVPDEKIILRYTNAIAEKHRKYLEYRKKNIVAEDDSYVVAVNGYPLSYRWADGEMPRVLKSVFPIGALQFLIDKDTSKITGARHQFRPMIFKSTGSGVSTEFFVNEQYSGISAILHSYANACMTSPSLGIDFLVAHNPLASRPVPHGLIVAGRECRVEPADGRHDLICQDTR